MNAMETIQITPLEDFFSPEEVRLIRKKFAEPHLCHRNCWEFCSYLYGRPEKIRFVAVSLAEYKGKPISALAHAVVRVGDYYFDPTLEDLFEFYVDYEYTLEEITDIFEREESAIIPFVPRQDKITRKWYRYRGVQKEFCPPYTL